MTARAQTVTILFTDLVSSTELLQRAGDERAQRIFKAHHRLLSEAVQAHGGHEVKWLGDGLMVAFDSARDAAQCAISMQQASRRPAAGERLQIRVGLHVGDALRDESDYFGTPVVIARRLCDTCLGGEILASDLVVRLLDGQQEIVFEDRGALALKGIERPVHAHEVRYEHDPFAMLAATPFVGRDDVLATLTTKLEAARGGAGSLVMLVGEPGIGKTRMASEFGDAARQAGARVLWGRCYDGEWAAPFSPFMEAVREYASSVPVDQLQQMLGTNAGVLTRIVPALRERLPDIEEPPAIPAEGERHRLLEAMGDFMSRLGGSRPLVLVLDDLHWADKGTIAMLRQVARIAPQERLLIIGAYRDVELDRTHPLADALQTLRRETNYERIVLKGLETTDINTLLTLVAEHEVPEGFAKAIGEETGGNPFFIREVVLHLVEEGKIVQEDGRWTATTAFNEMRIPEGVREVIGRRLSRVSESCGRMLTVASALTAGFSWELISAVADLGEARLLDAIDEALAAQLIVEGERGSYDFTHALIRHTLYEELSTPRRLVLHRQIGEALETLYQDNVEPHVTELAHHFYQANDLTRTVRYAQMSGEQAVALIAYDEAVAHYDRALELLGERDVAVRAGLLVARGSAEFKAGRFPKSRETFALAAQAARIGGNRDLFIRAAMQDFRIWGDDDSEMCELLQEALLLVPEESGLRARVLAFLVWRPMYEATMAEKRRLFARAIEMARQYGDEMDVAYVLIWVHWGLRHAPDVNDRAKLGLELLEISKRHPDDVTLILMAHHHRIYDLVDLGDIADAEKHIEAFCEVSSRYKLVQYEYLCAYYHAMLAQMRGDYKRALEQAAAATRLYPAIWGGELDLVFATVAAYVAGDQGRIDDLIRLWEPFADRELTAVPLRGSSSVARNASVQVRAGLALLYAQVGNRERACSMVERCLAGGVQTDLGWPVYITRVADAIGELEDATAASRLYPLLLPYDGLHLALAPGYVSVGAASRSLGILAATMQLFNEAQRHFENALAMNERLGARPWLARTQLDYARMLLKRDGSDDSSRARELVEGAFATARELGMERLAADCKSLSDSIQA